MNLIPLIRKTSLIILAFLLLSNAGCSDIKNNIRARLRLLRAEQIYSKTIKMKDRKVPFKDRQVYYKESCAVFMEVLEQAPGLFNEGRIEEATAVCFNAENWEAEEKFKEFEADYCARHPKECAYGFIEGEGI